MTDGATSTRSDKHAPHSRNPKQLASAPDSQVLPFLCFVSLILPSCTQCVTLDSKGEQSMCTQTHYSVSDSYFFVRIPRSLPYAFDILIFVIVLPLLSRPRLLASSPSENDNCEEEVDNHEAKAEIDSQALLLQFEDRTIEVQDRTKEITKDIIKSEK